ncbi:hypothetical protein TRAPUB_700 [Trametes pubescens]|uniref:F-box domain-containing protein n=1 Tax=Trametes pubescens TaxID=154538 RepID=A0A1M2VLK3_TRAPU|nr:hypothetical protein TRAPUB_700 [Trametes pubescens]
MFINRLPRMHFLTLGDFIWDILPLDPSFGATVTRFPAVTTLKLANGRFHSFSDFRRVVCSFAQLIHLYVENVEWRAIAPAYGATFVDPRLGLLWFKSRSEAAISALVDWLVGSRSTETLSDIQIWEQYSSDLPEVQRLMRAVGPRLEHFQVSLQFWTRDKRLDLSANTSLKTLHVRDIDSSSCQHLPFLLEHLSPGSLKDLSLHLLIPTLDDLGVLRVLWRDVANILARDAFALLPTVTIWLVKVPPAAAISIADLAGELRSWTPLDAERTYLRVFPLLALDG